jgi:hypothetical protein
VTAGASTARSAAATAGRCVRGEERQALRDVLARRGDSVTPWRCASANTRTSAAGSRSKTSLPATDSVRPWIRMPSRMTRAAGCVPRYGSVGCTQRVITMSPKRFTVVAWP